MSGPANTRVQRRLAAILAADVVGFSTLMGKDEEGTLTRIKALRREVIEPKVSEHQGRIFKTTGDGFLVEFSSPVEAVRCAVAVQEALASKAAQEASEALQLRIGINLGDIISEDDGDVYGNGVNVAARLEQLAEPGGVCMSGDAYKQVRSPLRLDAADLGERQLKNILEPVRVYRLLRSSVASDADPQHRTLPSLPEKPSIVVLPFGNLSGDPEQGYFADGITEDIITDLSKVSGLFVIASNSSFAYKGRAKDVREVSRELGVRYILEGTIRRAGSRVRINAQLIDGFSGGHLWAERFDRELEDIFAVQDDVTRTIIGALRVKLTSSEQARREGRGKIDPDAYDLLVRARQSVLQFRPDALVEARDMLRRAIEIHPELSPAYARLSVIHSVEYANQWSEPGSDPRSQALELAQKAVELDEIEPQAHHALAVACQWLGQLDESEQSAKRLIELDPNSSYGYLELGNVRHFRGENESAVELYREASRLDPQFDLPLHFLGRALLALGRFDEAEAVLRRRLALHRTSDMTRFYLASLCGQTGRHKEAQQLWHELIEINPRFSVEHLRQLLPYRDPSSFDRFVDGIRQAGLAI